MPSVQEILLRLVGIDDISPAANSATTSMNRLKTASKEASVSSQQIGEARSHVTALGNDAETSSKKVDKISKSFNGVKVAAGVAFTGAGMYLQQFTNNCVSAAATIESQMTTITAAFGMPVDQIENVNSDITKLTKETGYNKSSLTEAEPKLSTYTHGNYKVAEELMPMVTALSDINSKAPSANADVIGKAMMGSPMGLRALGINKSDLPSNFSQMGDQQKYEALNAVISKHINLQDINAKHADTAAGKYAIFGAELEQLEEDIGNDIIPTLTYLMENVLEPGIGFIEKHNLAPVAAGVLVLGTGLTLLAGPLLALEGIFGAGGVISGLKWFVSGINSVGSAAWEAIVKILGFAGSETAAGDAGLLSNGGIDAFAGSEAAAGYAGAEAAPEVGAFAASETAAGAAGASGILGGLARVVTSTLGSAIVGILGGTVLAPAIMGLSQPGGPLSADYGSTWKNWNSEMEQTVWGPMHNATNTNVKGSLADQLNLPGWIEGHLLPGTASAATPGKKENHPSIQQDIFGKHGLLDMSRYGWKFPSTAPVKKFGSQIPGLLLNPIIGVPLKMQQFGGSILHGLVVGLQSQFPSLTAAWQYVSDHFPHSQPKRGPLSTVRASEMYKWSKGISEAGLSGFNMLSGGVGKTLPTSGKGVTHNYGNSVNHYTIDASNMDINELRSMLIEINEAALKPTAIPNVSPTNSTATTTSV